MEEKKPAAASYFWILILVFAVSAAFTYLIFQNGLNRLGEQNRLYVVLNSQPVAGLQVEKPQNNREQEKGTNGSGRQKGGAGTEKPPARWNLKHLAALAALLSLGVLSLFLLRILWRRLARWLWLRKALSLPPEAMYDLFTQALSDAGLNSTGAGSNYVKTISAPSACGGYALSEFTNGQYSGWMYTVNGSHPDVGLKDYVLPDNATVVWHYVNDYRYEVADWVADADHPKLGNGTYYSLWLKAADTNPVCSAGTSAAK